MKMISIKKSFADCMSCPLLDAPSCILETNAEYVDEVEVIFVAENPGKEEVEKEVPLVGRAGQLFRKYMKKYKIDKLKYLLTNVVLCQTIKKDGTTGNPDDSVINLCKENCFKIIEACNPKLLVLMGATPMKAFSITTDYRGTVTTLRGQFYKWKNIDTFLTVHPSFVNRSPSFEPTFDSDMKKVAEFLGIEKVEQEVKVVETKKGVFFYKIPEKFYSEDFRLVDVQFLKNSKQILYIFRDKDNKKHYHKESDKYVCYQASGSSYPKKLADYKDLNQVSIPYSAKYKLKNDVTFEGDLKLTTKHVQDYYLQSKGDPSDTNLNILFLDIEVFSKEKDFPDVSLAKDPIVIICTSFAGRKKVYCLDPKVVSPETEAVQPSETIFVFKTEREMLQEFIRDVRELDPDIISGWNVVRFDLGYINNRCKALGIPLSRISKFGDVDIDESQNYADIGGINVVDQLELYRDLTQGLRENYRLATIAQLELGETKLEVGSFSETYKHSPLVAIHYCIRDVELLEKLEEKLKHISLLNELRRVCKCSLRAATGTLSLVDSLIVSFLKQKGIASKNADIHESEGAFEGAYVKEPEVGIHEFIVDFDFTSLYPSLIMTYNIGINTLVLKFAEYKDGYTFLYEPEKLPETVRVVLDPVYNTSISEMSRDDFYKLVKEKNLIATVSGCFFKPHQEELSIYSEILEMLLSSRKIYKEKMFEAKQKQEKNLEEMYNIRQNVYKILANAMYGALGNHVFRFFNVDCARTITLSGQEAMKTALVASNNFIEALKTGAQPSSKVAISCREMYGDLECKTPNVVAGDTDSLFVTYETLLKKGSVEEKLEQVNHINTLLLQFLNNEVVPSLVARHNVEPDFNRLELKNELVIKRGIYLAKKRYSNYVVSQEGRKVDEVRSMGLETRRSDYPSYSKECIKQLLDLILKPEELSIKRVLDFVKDKENDFIEKIKNGSKDIARPVTWTKKVSDYKTVPQGVKAMQTWNSLMYHAFGPGSRGYLFKLDGIDVERAPKEVVEKYDKEFLAKGKKIEEIAIPDEEPRLPNFFVPDIKAMLKFSWRDRYSLLLQPFVEVEETILSI